MKLKNLFWAIVAGAAALVSCEKEVDLGPAKISASPAEVTFTKEAGSQEITLNSSRDWKVNSGIPEWIALSKETGVADTKDQKVTISVTSNSGHDRSATLVFNIGYGKANVVVKQAGPEGEIDLGDGSLEKPFTVAGVLAYTRALPADQASEKNVYFKGKISTVATTFEASGTYGNATFYIVDEDGGESFYVFQTYYLGNRKWKSGDTDVQEGDNVIVCGKVVNYKGNTPETVSKGGSFIYSLNGKSEGGEPAGEGEAKGDGSLENPFNPAGISAVAAALADNAQSEQSYYIKGKISKVSTSFAASGNYGNANFYIVDEEDGTGEFYIYQTYYLEGKKWVSGQPDVAVGDIVTVYGPVTKYVGQYGTTLETVGKGASYIYSHTKGEGGDEPGGDTGEIKAVSVAEFLAASVSASQWYELTGTVSNIKSDVYGNFDLTDASGTVYIYGLTATKVEKNDKSFASLNIKEGDTVTLITLRAEYQGTAQGGGTPPAYIKSGDNPGGGGDTGEVITATIAEFNAAAESETQKYQLTGTIGGSINTTYGNFDLTDETGTVYVYGLTATDLGYGSKNDKSFASLGLVEGDKITIIGYRGSYGDKIEVLNAYFVEKVTGGDEPGGGDEPAGDVITATVAEFNAAAESETQKYQLTGTIGGSINTTYGNFDLTDETGTVYVYGLTATDLGYGAKNDKSFASLGLVEGDKITIIGYRGSYGDKIEVLNAYFVEKVTGGDEPAGDVITATVAEFNAAAESETQKYKLTGTIGGSINTTYGNFDLTDETGTVYVYGLTATDLGYGSKNDKSFASLGLVEGDKITIIGYRGSYGDKIEVLNAYFVEKVSGGDEPGGGDDPGTGSVFTSNVTWTSGSNNSYDESATVNNESGVKVLKLGTSKAVGSSTLTLPAGSTSLTFYAVSWSNKQSKVVFKVGGTEVASKEPAPNSGASGNQPYTITVTDSDKYTINFSATSTLTVETSGSNTRVILFGLNAQ